MRSWEELCAGGGGGDGQGDWSAWRGGGEGGLVWELGGGREETCGAGRCLVWARLDSSKMSPARHTWMRLV
jgi:hypothetical protein